MQRQIFDVVILVTQGYTGSDDELSLHLYSFYGAYYCKPMSLKEE